MDKKAQLGKLITTMPVFILLIVLIGVFIVMSVFAAKSFGPSEFAVKGSGKNYIVSDTTILFDNVNLIRGESVFLQPQEAYNFDGRVFVEDSYYIFNKGDGKFAGLQGEIIGIRNERAMNTTLLDALVFVSAERRDFSYNRYLLEREVLPVFLREHAIDMRDKDICFYVKIQEGSFRPIFFKKSAGQDEFKPMVLRRGNIPATAYFSGEVESTIKLYDNKLSKVTYAVNGQKKELFSYYGECLGGRK